MNQEIEEKQEMSLVKKVFIFALLSAFLIMGVLAMKRALPEHKEKRIYKAFKQYSPYKLEKRFGGLEIINTQTGVIEKPSNAEVLWRIDELDKEWAKEHLSVVNNTLIIKRDDAPDVQIAIETPKERSFIKKFFGI